MTTLEATDAEIPLPEQLKIHEVLFSLWQRNDAYSRNVLLLCIAKIKLCYGPWRALKLIFKQAEQNKDHEILGALTARFDMALANNDHSVSEQTIRYLCRRAWRYLRNQGDLAYADLASDILVHYRESTQWRTTWVANHIFYHELGIHNSRRFVFKSRPPALLKHRARQTAWRRSPRPLFSLLERAQSEQVRTFAINALRGDFRSTLREIEAQWTTRLTAVKSESVDEFVVWLFNNVAKFEQAAFIELGLQQTVLSLFDSPSSVARIYAAEYTRTHARDLPLNQLIRLVNNRQKEVRAVAIDLFDDKDPRKDVGLEIWGQLLETDHGFKYASEKLSKHFAKRELTAEWMKLRLLAPNTNGFKFATQQLLKLHSIKTLPTSYFCDLLMQLDYSDHRAFRCVEFATQQLEKGDLNTLPLDFLKLSLQHPDLSDWTTDLIDNGQLKMEIWPIDFLKTLAYEENWKQDSWVKEVKLNQPWAKELTFLETLSDNILNWFTDVRKFSPEQLGFDWLMMLAQRSEPQYHNFSVNYMNKAFLPADFAPQQESTETETADANTEINIDLAGASFLFTGKLALMTRSEATNKVTAAGGANSSGVTKKLDYLVIGDEGSSLYGEGRKGSKQVKAEKLVEAGAEMKIISETAFLQMLSGEQREFSENTIEEGCDRLWEMLTQPGKDDAPLAKFAYKYVRAHHPEICLAETDRPVDPGAEIPPSYLDYARVKSLFFDKRKPLRDLALELASWEFARWAPAINELVELSCSTYPEVQAFVVKAMTADESAEHKRYRVAPEVLTADAVYSFCESADAQARKLGMQLIAQNPRLQLPEELFRLTESPDRQIRAFVIKQFWDWYRDRGITTQWQPKLTTTVAKKDLQQALDKLGQGSVQRPANLPAPLSELYRFLRRVLFEIPPGRINKSGEGNKRLKALPARQAKLQLIETLRDLAMTDHHFAQGVLPLLKEFMGSRGQSEHAACLVAVTRIEHTLATEE